MIKWNFTFSQEPITWTEPNKVGTYSVIWAWRRINKRHSRSRRAKRRSCG